MSEKKYNKKLLSKIDREMKKERMIRITDKLIIPIVAITVVYFGVHLILAAVR